MGGANPNIKSASEQGALKYPVVDAKKYGYDDYFKSNPQVAGMAIGAGLNESPIEQERSIIVNPYNQYMSDPVKRTGLIEVESARHLMDETKYSPSFEITEKQKEWQKGLGAYANNDEAFKQSIVSRIIGGDDVPDATPEQISEAKAIQQKLNSTTNKTNTMGGANTQSKVQTTGNPALDQAKEIETTKQINDRGMSGMADESLSHYWDGTKRLVKEMIDPKYKRDIAKPVSSYEAIDVGLK